MNALERIATPLGMGLWFFLGLAFVFSLVELDRRDDRSRTVCSLRWSHAVTYDDSLKTAQRCGKEGQK